MQNKEGKALAQLAKFSEKNVAVSFSGGKDSLVALDLAYRVGIKRVVFCDTSIEFEETVQYVKRVEQFYGIKIDVVSAPVSFFSLTDIVGIPSRRMRWCCEVLKFGPLARYAMNNNLHGFVTGLRRDESKRRVLYEDTDENPLIPVKQINPILEWNEHEVWNYIKSYSLPTNPLYRHFKRIGCWCCPYRTDNDWRKIEQIFPTKAKMFKGKLLEFAQRMKIKDKKRFIEERGWTKWASPLRKTSVGVYSPCSSSDKIDLIINGESTDQIRRIVKVLPILTRDFFVIGKRLRVTINDLHKRHQKLNILIEKALNCRACGACLSLCKTGALLMDQESIYVDADRCIGCQECLASSPNGLRGSCIVRNYSPKRRALIKL